MSDCFSGRAEADCIPIYPITGDSLKARLNETAQAQRDWVEGQRFDASPGSYCPVPGAGGRPAAVWVGVREPFDMHALGALPLALPEDDYRIATDWDDGTIELACLGWSLGAYRYSRYRTAAREPARLAFSRGARRDRIRHLQAAVYQVRDWINTPTEDLGPEQMADIAQGIAGEHGADFKQVQGDELKRAGFPAIHAVGRASHRAPRLIEVTWGRAKDPAVVLVGKGVCFDTGGLDMKGSEGMRWMKKDMGGAAHALALAELIMAEQLPVNLRVLIPAVENAVGPNAYRPGDVVHTRRGLSVEIGNTDAEGRMVLADALTAAAEARPELILDFATLTGAARVALGTDLPALYANDDVLGQELLEAGARAHDPLWRMPLYQPYAGLLQSNIADLCNVSSGKYAGSITAALFLERFVLHNTPWAHLDLFGWNDRERPGRPEGGEAFGLRAAFDYLEQRCTRV